MLLHLHITYGCFCARTAELSTCQNMAHKTKIKKYLLSGTLQKFANPWSRQKGI